MCIGWLERCEAVNAFEYVHINTHKLTKMSKTHREKSGITTHLHWKHSDTPDPKLGWTSLGCVRISQDCFMSFFLFVWKKCISSSLTTENNLNSRSMSALFSRIWAMCEKCPSSGFDLNLGILIYFLRFVLWQIFFPQILRKVRILRKKKNFRHTIEKINHMPLLRHLTRSLILCPTMIQNPPCMFKSNSWDYFLELRFCLWN